MFTMQKRECANVSKKYRKVWSFSMSKHERMDQTIVDSQFLKSTTFFFVFLLTKDF